MQRKFFLKWNVQERYKKVMFLRWQITERWKIILAFRRELYKANKKNRFWGTWVWNTHKKSQDKIQFFEGNKYEKQQKTNKKTELSHVLKAGT